MSDPYADLGLPYGADPETVRDAYSRLSRRLTPERRAAEPEAAAAYARIAAAYAELSKRKALVDPFEEWSKGGPDIQGGPPPRVAAPAPAEAAVEDRPELRPGEEFSFRRFKGRLCVVVGILMALRGASAVYLDPSGWVNRLMRHLPWIGELEREPAFLVMIIGMATLIWGAGSFMISDREAEELERRGRLARLRRRGRRFF